MNVEEKIKKKENRKIFLKKLILPTIITAIVLIVGYYITTNLIKSLSNRKPEDSKTGEIIEENANSLEDQIVGIGNGTSSVAYKGYTYIHMYESDGYKVIRFSSNEAEPEEIISYEPSRNGFSSDSLWIYKDNIYIKIGNNLKRYNLDGKEETNVVTTIESSPIFIDTDKEIILYFLNEKNDIGIAKLDGTILREIPKNTYQGVFSDFINEDSSNIYFETKEIIDNTYEVIVMLYMINKETLDISQVATEQLIEEDYGCGFYQVESYNDNIYYIAGSRAGSGGYFNGGLYSISISKNGTDKVQLTETGGEGDVLGAYIIPHMTIKNNFLYYEGYRIDLKTNKSYRDYFGNGDIIDDDDYIYTTSMSDQDTISLVKYKVGTNFEDLKVLFEKEVPNGAMVHNGKVQIEFRDNYIYITITYTDMDNTSGFKAWTGVDYLVETYRIKKDGSNLEQVS